MSISAADTVSLTSRRTISTSKHWAAIFDERIYQICNIAHPGLPIDFDAVEHIRYFLQSIVFELIETRATSVAEVDKTAEKLFGYGLNTICKDAWDNMHQQLQHKHKYQKTLKTALESQHRLAAVIKGLDTKSWKIGFLAEFEEFVAEETEHAAAAAATSSNRQTYESVAVDFLRDERRFIRELNRINVFRRRIESIATSESDKTIVANLFGNLHEIHDLALKIERTLEDAIELNDTQCIGMGIWEYGEAYEFDTYTFYIKRDGSEMNESRHATYVINDTIKALLESERFSKLFMKSGEHSSSLDGQSFRLAVQYVLPQLLHIPIFHIYQYHEYINVSFD
ncbi:Protein CBR-SOS-1 [Caenorhabditis briggsae]|uniref:Protein CBR-SOS-1 n=1 Tax=Caenorhabditis briggsae TaxID=6238 RepID=H8WHC1_CAEBR|nr:Protein CBR-SOS-1 [Caenorhabditis briggsae]CCG58603.1 Protein CBR-SOS-1 [Caenorhabditis briggsae]